MSPAQKAAETRKRNQDARTGWYYCAEFGYFHGIRHIEVGDGDYGPDAWAGNIYDPFPTFGAAKRDALGYFSGDIEVTRSAMVEVRETKRSTAKRGRQ